MNNIKQYIIEKLKINKDIQVDKLYPVNLYMGLIKNIFDTPSASKLKPFLKHYINGFNEDTEIKFIHKNGDRLVFRVTIEDEETMIQILAFIMAAYKIDVDKIDKVSNYHIINIQDIKPFLEKYKDDKHFKWLYENIYDLAHTLKF